MYNLHRTYSPAQFAGKCLLTYGTISYIMIPNNNLEDMFYG